ncbi:MAG: methyltransferase domain-containing protein [Planctomycetota bacterium]
MAHAMPTTNKALERFYRWNAPIYDLTRWVILRGRRLAVDALRLSPADRVLEIGCGTGLQLSLLHEKVGPEGFIVGLDLSEPMLRRAARKLPGQLALVRADAARLPLAGTFDAVLMAYSLTVIPEWRAAIEQACARLVPGGRVVVLDFAPPRPHRLAPLHRILNRYLSWNHVETDRDFAGVLKSCTRSVEPIDVPHAYVTVLRGTK